ncbi:MAG: hypothetical protein LBS25_01335 [Candidatus Symbiothrix sp.]|jgi:uncharacterized protein YacL|nr:hypothetical protein [Candidatus Symbiothrix sp.]
MGQNANLPQVALPNATAVLILGIASIPTCCCYGVLGLIFAIIALVLANGAAKLYNDTPERFTEGSYKNLNAGKICAIIGLVLSILFVIYVIGIIAYTGFEALQNPELMQERIQELFNQ